jgi:hypothetical protein
VGVTEEAFRVRFANGQTSFCGSLEEARRIIERRAEHNPPPPDILPAEIATIDESSLDGLRLVERYPRD